MISIEEMKWREWERILPAGLTVGRSVEKNKKIIN